MELKAAIVGCGLIGAKRAQALKNLVQISVCCDIEADRARAMAAKLAGARACTDWREAVTSKDVDIVFIATTHDMLAALTEEACSAGKHVLVEKPAGRTSAELEKIAACLEKTGAIVRVGFNHRYHRAFRKAQEILQTG